MADRKAELERKREKLRRIKQERERRQARAQAEDAAGSAPAGGADSHDLDSLVANLIGDAASGDTAGEPSADGAPTTSPQRSFRRARRAELTTVAQTSVDIPPMESVTYERETQTNPIPELGLHNKEEEDVEEAAVNTSVREEPEEVETEDVAIQPPDDEPEPAKELTEEEVTEILQKTDFGDFFDKSTRLVERVLNVDYDPLVDYGAGEADAEVDVSVSDSVSVLMEFANTTSTGRAVTDLNWNPKHPQLLAASYIANPDAPNDPDGIVQIWSLKLPTRPEYTFECQSPVLSTCFSPFQSNYVLGGTYSGQIVLWDISMKRTPVQRSTLSGEAHTHPVYCMDVVGTQNAHNYITVSTDGKLCTWSLEQMVQPGDVMELQYGASKAIAATCISFRQGDINNFVAGTEEGSIYPASRHEAKGGIAEAFEGHAGPVTGIDYHRASGGHADFNHLFVSSSTDWTVKLWSSRGSEQPRKPLYSFENAGDYVYDVQWSPIHPALFVSADGMGRLDFWNINLDTEVPVVSLVVGDGKQAINRVQWHSSGHKLAVGMADGRIIIYNVGEKLSNPRPDEHARLKETLQEMRTASAEASGSVGGAR
eukprot:m.58484 g.58484  ORF g.58484 m.58484 type:complete len:597 (-) comp12873_c0_seq1:40-1830(-)